MNKPRLVPARPDASADAAAYLPRIPWRYIVLGALSLTLLIGGYYLKERRKASDLRAAMVRVHEVELAQAREPYVALRDKLEGLIMDAAAAEPATLVDPRLHLPGLRSGNGLYLRLPLSEAGSKEAIAEAARWMEPDRIATCLGLAPPSARGLYEKGEFLMPAFLAEIQKQDNVLRLRVSDEMLSRRIRADLPSVLGLLRSDWFMLVLQEGENRRDSPVRVFLWDLQGGELLLRTRVKSQGVLLTSRILSQGMPNGPRPTSQEVTTGAANDCSIASQLKTLTASGK
jgi:hypothetical protein